MKVFGLGVILILVVLGRFYIAGIAPEPANASLPEEVSPTAGEATPQIEVGLITLPDSRVQWALKFLSRLGNDTPTLDTVGYVWAWQGGENTEAKFNPLATTQGAPNDTCFNYLSGHCGVRNYTDEETGLDASVTTLTNGSYPKILNALLTNDLTEAFDSHELGVWGTGLGNVTDGFKKWHPFLRKQLVNRALELQGIPYISGGRSAHGGDCSGTMQYIYKSTIGIDIGATTFTQFPHMEHIEPEDLQPGDLWYGQYSDDQHTGMVADVDGDGTWDLINNGGLQSDMHVDYNFLETDYFSQHTMGFGRVFN